MSIPKKVREALRERSSGDPLVGLCEVCGARATNAHHRKNKSQGGQDVLSNLLMVCGSGVTGCHGKITVNPAWARQFGYSVRSTESPAEISVWLNSLYGGHEWLYLNDDGTLRRTAA